MRITMHTSAATQTQCYQGGHTYDVADADAAEFIRAGHAREAEGIEDPDIVITRKPGTTGGARKGKPAASAAPTGAVTPTVPAATPPAAPAAPTAPSK